MPRGPRLVVPGVALHVVQRGHDRRDCFQHETDYLVYLSSLRELSTQTQCALHAYCLMTNHVHLLLAPSSVQGCAVLMRNLGQRYVQYFNRRYQRRGTLWEGRYHSCLVDSAPYVIACYRYIERNPVRAGMVASAADYLWSSHKGNAGEANNKLLTPHPEYSALALNDASRHTAYQGLFAAADDPAFLAAIRDATNGGFALVGEALKASLPANLQHRLERKQPGPRPAPTAQSVDLAAQMTLELGLRPRTS
ncbi:MAG TPA: transposase [Burkholderiales bacterium]